jgi:hypothetical protein
MGEIKDNVITIPKAILKDILSRLEKIERILRGADREHV